ncbi:MAG: hypothetical protein AAF959_17870 [Cyanobacteria bacterium P01_D01_bin.56]
MGYLDVFLYVSSQADTMLLPYKKWSGLKIVSETPEQLILKTRPGQRVLMMVILPFILIVGLCAIALGIGGFIIVFTEPGTPIQILKGILFSSFFTGVGIGAPTVIFMNAVTSQLWTFDRRQQILYRVRTRLYRKHYFEYPFTDIQRVYLKRGSHRPSAPCRIEVALASGKKLSLSMWTQSLLRGTESEMIKHIQTFMEPRG